MIIANNPTISEEARYNCPFYGFYCSDNTKTLVEKTDSNICGFIPNHKTPCAMDISARSPDWRTCGLNNSENLKALEQIIGGYTVYLKERISMSFADWYEKIMGETELEDAENQDTLEDFD
jgi:hypothetical protein